MSARDSHLIDKALAEARAAGWLETAPNPRVGALALPGGPVVGRGCHRGFGGPHAEEAALRDAGAWDDAAGRPLPGRVDEMVVSLEPCSAAGGEKRRPPCTELLLQAGVTRVLVGAVDPDPRHAGAGLGLLEAAGVEVRRIDQQSAFAGTNGAFLAALAAPERPWVLLKWAASLDGKTATDGGASQWITGPESRAEVHRLRAVSDAVLAGPGTLRADDPRLDARPGGEPAATQPLRVILLPDGQLPEGAALLGCAGPRAWLVGEAAEPSPALARALGQGDACLRLPSAPGGHLDLEVALRWLRREQGVRRLLVEGGPRLHGALLDAGLADAVVRYEAPLLLGGHHGSLLSAGCDHPRAALRLVDEERIDLGPDLRRAFRVEAAPPATGADA